MESEPGLTATYEQTKDSQKTDNLPIKEKREIFGVPHVPLNLLISCLAEKGGSRTLRGPYDPQTGFEDQRHHRAPSFSVCKINYLRDAPLFCLSIRLSICDVPKASAMSVRNGRRIKSFSIPRLTDHIWAALEASSNQTEGQDFAGRPYPPLLYPNFLAIFRPLWPKHTLSPFAAITTIGRQSSSLWADICNEPKQWRSLTIADRAQLRCVSSGTQRLIQKYIPPRSSDTPPFPAR